MRGMRNAGRRKHIQEGFEERKRPASEENILPFSNSAIIIKYLARISQ